MPEHLLFILTLGKVARFYRLQGRYAQSQELFERVLSIAERALGSVHPELATQLNNCGVLYRQMQKYADAGRVLNRAIDIWSQLFGEDNRRTANSRYNLGKTFHEQGELLPLMENLPIGQQAIHYIDFCAHTKRSARAVGTEVTGYARGARAYFPWNHCPLYHWKCKQPVGDFADLERNGDAQCG